MREQYKNYWSEEDIAQDYDNFKHDWEYDEKSHFWTHKTGIEMRVGIYDLRRLIEERGLSEWQEARRAEGLSKDEIEYYERRLVNQIKFIFKKNYQPPRKRTIEEQAQTMAEIGMWNIERCKETGKYTNQQIENMKKKLQKNVEELLREGLAKDGR